MSAALCVNTVSILLASATHRRPFVQALIVLDLQHNGMGGAGIEYLGDALKVNSVSALCPILHFSTFLRVHRH